VFSKLLLSVLPRVGGQDLVYPLRLLYGRSFGIFLQRIARLRRVASSMRAADEAPPLPVRLQIETTDVCNLKCRMCTREVIDGMNTSTMSLEQFKDIVAQISPYYLTLNGLGEPLIDKTIFEKLEFIHERGIMTAMPTNGTYIRGEKLEKLAQNLPDTLTFSIDGGRKDSYEYVRVLEIEVKPGDSEPPHTHTWPSVVYYYRLPTSRRGTADGKPPVDRPEFKTQQVTFENFSQPIHTLLNTGNFLYQAHRVEIKPVTDQKR
jgi:hypothetical protein